MSLLARWTISALALWLTAQLNIGLFFEPAGVLPIFLTAIVLGFVNAVVRPIMVVLTLPFTLLSFGLFLLVVNAFAISIVATLTPLNVTGFGGALVGALVLTIVNSILTSIFKKNNED